MGRGPAAEPSACRRAKAPCESGKAGVFPRGVSVALHNAATGKAQAVVNEEIFAKLPCRAVRLPVRLARPTATYRDYFPLLTQHIKLIGPRLHQLSPLRQVLRMVVGSAHLIAFLMSKLQLD